MGQIEMFSPLTVCKTNAVLETMGKQMSSNSFENKVTYKSFT